MEFMGWNRILEIVEACRSYQYYAKPNKIFSDEVRERMRERLHIRDQELIASSFELGGRITETLMARVEMFEIKSDKIIVSGMPVLKRYDKIDEILEIVEEKPTGALSGQYHWSHVKDGWVRRRYVTKPRFVTRGRFIVPLHEPLAELLVSRIENADDYLFPAEKKRMNGTPHITRGTAYKMLQRVALIVGIPLWNHRWRGERACQCASEYGWREAELDRFFMWENSNTAKKYAKLAIVDMEKSMTPEKIRMN